MEAFILKANESEEYYFDEGCFILELSNTQGDQGLSIARARVKPNVTTQLHRLQGTIERYVILSGLAEVDIEGLVPERLTVGDVVIIPANCTQRISNIGTEDLVFLAICSPRFRSAVYEAILETEFPV